MEHHQLIEAIKKNNVEMVSSILKENPNILNDKTKYMTMPLNFACDSSRSNPKIVQILIDNGADVNEKNKNDHGRTPLSYACNESNAEVVKILLDSGADANATDDDRWTPLLIACDDPNPIIIKMLIDKKADVNYNGVFLRNPWKMITRKDNPNPEIMKMLFDAGVIVYDVKYMTNDAKKNLSELIRDHK